MLYRDFGRKSTKENTPYFLHRLLVHSYSTARQQRQSCLEAQMLLCFRSSFFVSFPQATSWLLRTPHGRHQGAQPYVLPPGTPRISQPLQLHRITRLQGLMPHTHPWLWQLVPLGLDNESSTAYPITSRPVALRLINLACFSCTPGMASPQAATPPKHAFAS